MRLRLIAEPIRTKKDVDIDITVQEDSEGDNNRGWQCDYFKATQNSKEVGYLKCSYIPIARFNAFYTSIFVFLDKVEGGCNYRTTKKLWEYFILSLKTLGWGKYNDLEQEYEELPPEDAEAKMKAQIAEWMKSPQMKQKFKLFKVFKDNLVDKPYVDFIRVGTLDDSSLQRQGIGLALYEYAARWYAKRGMVLYASETQSSKAEGAWAYMEHHGYPIKTEKALDLVLKPRIRRYLDYR